MRAENTMNCACAQPVLHISRENLNVYSLTGLNHVDFVRRLLAHGTDSFYIALHRILY